MSIKWGIRHYKKHFKEYKDDSAAVIYHNDRERIKNNAGKVVELKDRAPNVHKKNKDNENKDFDIDEPDWKDCSFSSNKRIQGAISDCEEYLRNVLSISKELWKKY